MGKKEIIEMLKKFKNNLEEKYGIKKIIFFGSYAMGKERKDSDIDLIIVTNQDKKKIWYKLYHEWHMVHKINYPVDFICYTEEEFNKLKNKISIVSIAIKEGIEI